MTLQTSLRMVLVLFPEVEAEVAWADVKGLAGLKFLHVPKSSQQELEYWLDQRMEEKFPGSSQRVSGLYPVVEITFEIRAGEDRFHMHRVALLP